MGKQNEIYFKNCCRSRGRKSVLKPAKLLFFLFLFSGFYNKIKAQDTTIIGRQFSPQRQEKEELIQQMLELFAEGLEEEVDLTDLYFQLSYRYDHPLELNTATHAELQTLYLLSAYQLNNLLQHRQQFGDFISIYELQSVEGFDVETIRKILPFVKVGRDISERTFTLKDYLTKGNHDFFTRYSRTLEQERGYKILGRNRFLGSPYNLYSRYNYRFGTNLSIGFTADKDAGEEFFKGTQKQGFDFYSAHLFYSGGKLIKTFALGDFQLQFGQGLTVWSALALNKTPDVLNVARNARGILPFRSANENLFMRGAAVSIGLGKKFTLSSFVSRKNIDASRTEADTLSGQEAFFSSIVLSGYHRNLPELEKKNTVQESMAGGEISFHDKNIKIGLSAIYGSYNLALQREQRVYNLFTFNDKSFLNAGLNYSWQFRNIYFFGESAMSGNAAMATVNGALISLHPKFDMGVVYRNFARNYQAPYANAFSEASGTNNEEGTYLAAVFRPAAKWRISGFVDRFSFPWLRYRVYAPSHGSEYLLDINYNPAKKIDIYLRYRSQTKARNISSTQNPEPVYQLVDAQKNSLRLHVSYLVNQKISLRSRIEVSEFTEKREGFEPQIGFLMFQDLDYRSLNRRYGLTFRYVFFDVESYDARIYTFENDVPFAFSIPFFQHQGFRYYLLGQYRLSRFMTLHARFARTTFLNSETFGSGLNEIAGNHRTEVKVQLRIRW